MKIGIDTNTDSYEMWKKVQALIEDAYQEPVSKEKTIEATVMWGTGDPELTECRG